MKAKTVEVINVGVNLILNLNVQDIVHKICPVIK